jgi:hypothetical protein
VIAAARREPQAVMIVGARILRNQATSNGGCWRLSVRAGEISSGRTGGAFERLLLPHVPEGVGRSLHGIRSISCRPS